MHVDRLNFYSQRQLALKMTKLSRFQKSINKGNTQVNCSLKGVQLPNMRLHKSNILHSFHCSSLSRNFVMLFDRRPR